MKLILSLLWLLPLGFLSATGTGEAPVLSQIKAEVIYLEGTLSINGLPGNIGDTIPEGALVSTGPQSQAEIIFGDKNILSLGPSTKTILSLTGIKKTVDLQNGRAAAVFKKLEYLAGGSMNLRTPTASGAIRGTSFYTSVNTDGETYFCTCNGSILLEDNAGSQQRDTKNAHHGAFEFKKLGSGVVIEPSTLKDHGDQEIEALAKKIGVTVDWSIPD